MQAYKVTARGSFAHPDAVDAEGKVTRKNYLVYFTEVIPHTCAIAEEGKTLPDVPKWSGKSELPAIGSDVDVRMNGIGPSKVHGYFVEHGWLGLHVKPYNPPEWYVKQNGRESLCHVFGMEIR